MATFPTIADVYAKGPKLLWVTQSQYEQATKKRINANTEHTKANVIYKTAVRLAIKKLRKEGVAATAVKEIAKAECHEEEIAEINAKSELEKITIECEYLCERIQSLKKIMNENPNHYNTTGR